MGLEAESITALRGIAQSMSAKWTLSDDKRSLIEKIRATAASKVPAPNTEPNDPMDQRLRVRAPLRACTQKEIYEALQPFFERGLILDFPNEEQWRVQKIIRHEDSGTLWMPLRAILKAAKDIIAR